MIIKKSTYNILWLAVLTLILAGCLKDEIIQADYTAYGTIEPPTVAGPDSPPENPTGHMRWTSPQDGMTMVHVPAGEFLMGPRKINPDDIESNQPQFQVYLDAFWIDQTEVTNIQYARCVIAGACQKPIYTVYDVPFGAPVIPDYLNNPDYADYPAVAVSWYGADAYCRWAGRRLPSEAEWKKAARGTDGRLYPWGNEEPDESRANFCNVNCPVEPHIDSVDDGYRFTAPVGNYPAGISPFGTLDMAGNVAEWVQDWAPEDYSTPALFDNPRGPSTGWLKLFLGGSWASFNYDVRSSLSSVTRPRVSSDEIGFRCVMDIRHGE